MKRLIAISFSLALATTASFALADVPGPTTTTGGTTAAGTGAGGSGTTAASTGTGTTAASTTAASTTGAGGGGSTDGGDDSGCSAAPGSARGSAALLLGLGMLFAIPLARRRSGAKK